MYSYNDVICVNNQLHRVQVFANILRFDNDPNPITLPATGMFARIGNGPLGLFAVCRDAVKDTILIVYPNGKIIETIHTVGNWSAAIGPTGEVFIQNATGDAQGNTDLQVLNHLGVFLRTHTVQYSSVGIHYIDAANNPVMSIGLPKTIIDGVEILLPLKDQFGNIVAQTDKYTNSGGVLILNDGKKLFWNHFINRYPFIASSTTAVWCAFQGNDVPLPGDYSNWYIEPQVPTNPPPVEPPPTHEQVIHVKSGDVLKIIVD